MAAEEHPDTQVIKQSIAYRAKWRANPDLALPTFKTVPPPLIVPHPSNRCVTALRTKQLIGDIVQHACDVEEANNTAVAVEENPDLAPDSELSFQKKFEARVPDPDMATFIPRHFAVGGSLSHGHLNCGM